MTDQEPSADDRPGAAGQKTGTRLPVFGDRGGLAVFLGALCTLGATWQVGFFITDTYAVANGLVNLAHGSLAVDRVYYSLTLDSQPGLYVGTDGLYARNYGEAFLALPAYYVLDALVGVVDLALLLVAAWGLTFIAFFRQIGLLTGRNRVFRAGGSIIAALVVVGSVPVVSPIEDDQVGIVALQVVSMLSVAVTALALYRLVARVHGRRVGVVVGAATVVATPLWFWASIPKRHALTCAAVATLLFWFVVSRKPTGRVRVPLVDERVSRSLAIRAGGYALIGFVTWVHAFEGILLLGTFGAADLATASETSRRALLAIAVAATAGFAPFFATNIAVNGSPFEPPRLASSYTPGNDDFDIGPTGEVIGPDERADGTDNQRSGSGSGDGGDGTETADGTSSAGDNTPAQPSDGDSSGLDLVVGLYDGAAGLGTTALGHGESIVDETGTAPQRLYHTYVRSGRASGLTSYDVNDEEPVDLTLLESNPLFGGLSGILAGILATAVTARRSREWGRSRVRHVPSLRGWHRRIRATDPARQTDAFAFLTVVGFGVMYFPRLPLHSQLTVRYILPMIPPLLYLLARVPTVAKAVKRQSQVLAGSYAASVVAGLLAVAFVVPRLDPAIGEVMQLHGIVNLGVAAVLGVAVAVARLGHSGGRIPALALGLAAGATSVLVLAMQLVYFEYGTYAVPLVRLVADAVTVL